MKNILVCLFCLGLQARGAELTAEQVMEKSLEAQGGRQAIEKITTRILRGRVEATRQGYRASIEVYSKPPGKRLVVTKVEGMGEVRQGFDGSSGWIQDTRGLRRLDGAELVAMRRESVFNADLRWRELYPKAEVAGRNTVNGREVIVLRLTTADGPQVIRYYDAQTFLLARSDMLQAIGEKRFVVQTYLDDYRVVSGVKIPHEIRQKLPTGEIVTKITSVLTNLPIEEARFAPPAK